MYAPGILRVVELTALMLMAIHIVLRIAEHFRPQQDSEFDMDAMLAEMPSQSELPCATLRQGEREATYAC